MNKQQVSIKRVAREKKTRVKFYEEFDFKCYQKLIKRNKFLHA